MAQLSELPQPPTGVSGWPWTEGGPEYGARCPDGRPWPKITVITPSGHHGHLLEETMRSVVLQDYPNLEYIIVDEDCSDESREIVRKYERWITHSESASAMGKAHAINRGLSRATGDIFNWIAPGDILTAGALGIVGQFPDDVDLLAGGRMTLRQSGNPQHVLSQNLNASLLLRRDTETKLQQAATWMRREQAVAAGSLDESMHHSFGWDFYIRYLHRFPTVKCVNIILAYRHQIEARRVAVDQKLLAHERLRSVEKLRADLDYHELWSDCDFVRAKHDWWQQLTDTMNNRNHSALRRATVILTKSGRNPRIRWDGLTRKALRVIIAGRAHRPCVPPR